MYGKANVVCKLLPDILRRILKQNGILRLTALYLNS